MPLETLQSFSDAVSIRTDRSSDALSVLHLSSSG